MEFSFFQRIHFSALGQRATVFHENYAIQPEKKREFSDKSGHKRRLHNNTMGPSKAYREPAMGFIRAG